MTRMMFTIAALFLAGLAGCQEPTKPPSASATTPTIVVYKSPTCGCCGAWVEHLRENGFTVEVVEEQDLTPRKAELGVPRPMGSCHTATIDGYTIEGHVPASDIRRLLAERPQGRGLAVPGMPIGSPGMEVGDRRDPYIVWLFGGEGDPQAFAHHGSDG